jgi:Fe2+ or Zn2+ uptake regulation protein
MSYFNTNKETGVSLENSINQATTQEDIIISLFDNSNCYTPYEILEKCEDKGYKFLLTSVRRAMCNLTDKNLLVKNDIMKLGPYGKKVHTWSLNREQ